MERWHVHFSAGEVAEWSKAPVSKTGMGETPSGVRISPSPHVMKRASLWRSFHYEDGIRKTEALGAESGSRAFSAENDA